MSESAKAGDLGPSLTAASSSITVQREIVTQSTISGDVSTTTTNSSNSPVNLGGNPISSESTRSETSEPLIDFGSSISPPQSPVFAVSSRSSVENGGRRSSPVIHPSSFNSSTSIFNDTPTFSSTIVPISASTGKNENLASDIKNDHAVGSDIISSIGPNSGSFDADLRFVANLDDEVTKLDIARESSSNDPMVKVLTQSANDKNIKKLEAVSQQPESNYFSSKIEIKESVIVSQIEKDEIISDKVIKQEGDSSTKFNTGTGEEQCSSETRSTTPPVNLSQEYHLKWIKWKGTNKLPIVTQNSNGPCPLLAIMNVLLLRKNIAFPPMIEIITAEQLMGYLCDFIISNVPKNLPEVVKLDYEQNFQDAMNILPRLSTGLDVNVRFTGISDFEYTSECIIFDLLGIPLYHGWLVDPQDKDVLRAVDTMSYNQLVDRIISDKGNPDPHINALVYIAEDFLNTTASQLTKYGLFQLIQQVKEDELCILFRNNHFITLYKHMGKLYQLLTDQGFLTESNMVWETLNNIEGDTHFVDGDFVILPPKPSIPETSSTFTNPQQQIDQDYLIALSLEQELKQEWQRTNTNESATESEKNLKAISVLSANDASAIIPPGFSDEEIARRLQAEENQYFEQMQRGQSLQQQHQQQQQPHHHNKNHQQGQQRQGSGVPNSSSRIFSGMANHTVEPRHTNTSSLRQQHQTYSHTADSGSANSGSHSTSRPHRISAGSGSGGRSSGGNGNSIPTNDRSLQTDNVEGDNCRNGRSKNCSII